MHRFTEVNGLTTKSDKFITHVKLKPLDPRGRIHICGNLLKFSGCKLSEHIISLSS